MMKKSVFLFLSVFVVCSLSWVVAAAESPSLIAATPIPTVVNVSQDRGLVNTEGRLLAAAAMQKESAFPDIVSHWAKSFITALVDQAVLSGYGDGTFGPDNLLTRSEAVKIGLIAFKHDVASDFSSNSFTDVKPTDWYATFLATAKADGIINGLSDGTFRPNDRVSRAESLKIIVAAMGIKPASLAGNENRFPDVPIGAWYRPYINWATANSIVGGYPDGTFGPDKAITRAEFSKITYLTLQLAEAVKTPTPDPVTSAGDTDVTQVIPETRKGHIDITEGIQPESLQVVSLGKVSEVDRAGDFEASVYQEGVTAVAAMVPDTAFGLMDIVIDKETPTLNAQSTAEALVFMAPNLVSSDPELSKAIREVIQADENVAKLATEVKRVLQAKADPLQDAAFQAAYARAIDSVLTMLNADQ